MRNQRRRGAIIHPGPTGTHLQQQLVSIKKTTTLSRVRVRPEPNTPILFLPFLPFVPSFQPECPLPARSVLGCLSPDFLFLPVPQDLRSAVLRSAPLGKQARKMRFDGRESKRGVTIDGPIRKWIGRNTSRGRDVTRAMSAAASSSEIIRDAPSSLLSFESRSNVEIKSRNHLDRSISITDPGATVGWMDGWTPFNFRKERRPKFGVSEFNAGHEKELWRRDANALRTKEIAWRLAWGTREQKASETNMARQIR